MDGTAQVILKPHAGIDVTKISKADTRNLCSTFLEAVQQFIADPKNQAAFERWLEARDAK